MFRMLYLGIVAEFTHICILMTLYMIHMNLNVILNHITKLKGPTHNRALIIHVLVYVYKRLMSLVRQFENGLFSCHM